MDLSKVAMRCLGVIVENHPHSVRLRIHDGYVTITNSGPAGRTIKFHTVPAIWNAFLKQTIPQKKGCV